MSLSDELQQPMGEWECVECGHVAPGIATRRPRQCPECEAPAKALEFFPWEDDRPVWDVPRDEGEIEEDEEE